ncbi:MAG: nitroreductase family deazaflavin-dependent oxidoreductase [Anaerolineales bacterium]|nr:nitroreductase family deazaflavin-dependent oxidoreductase [Anaerolineales bacterium]
METKPSKTQEAVLKFATSKPGVWLFSRVAHYCDSAVLRLTKNRHSLSSILTGKRAIIATCIGAKSGVTRRVPLLAVINPDNVILVASNWGQAKHPAWYHNMKANPEVQLMIDNQEMAYSAQEVINEREYNLYWNQAVLMYPGY